MSFPLDSVDIGFRNQVDDIRSFLDSRHLDHYTVYNLSPKSYRTAKFHSRVRNFRPNHKVKDINRVFYPLRAILKACAPRHMGLKNYVLSILLYL